MPGYCFGGGAATRERPRRERKLRLPHFLGVLNAVTFVSLVETIKLSNQGKSFNTTLLVNIMTTINDTPASLRADCAFKELSKGFSSTFSAVQKINCGGLLTTDRAV